MNATEAVLITSVFLLAGTVKGVVGLGLPTVSLGLLTASLGLEAAMALMLAPSFVTNVWQALSGGNGLIVLKRIWPFLLLASIAVWPGVALGGQWQSEILISMLGALLIAYGLSGLTRPEIRTPPSRERWAAPLTGCINGVLTGLTGSFVVPGVLYLQSLSLSRDQLVQAMGMLFTCSTIALAVGLAAQGRLPAQMSLGSIVAVLPALLGMIVGRGIRAHVSEAAFKRIFFAALIALGTYILAPALFA
jgi:uncharacterized membrane protein YfcA